MGNGFGAYVASLGLTQLRIAETEKYAHVTYFFSGGVEAPYPGEDRVLVPSPKVATYDLKPEMSAFEVTDKLVAAIGSGKYDAIVCNYANGDMVGHTGNLDAAVKAIETLDACIGRVVTALRAAGGELLITADHGNAEKMRDEVTGQPHTAHTLCLVPCVYVGRPAKIADGGSLQDVAPTLLAMLGLAATRGNDGAFARRPSSRLARDRYGTRWASLCVSERSLTDGFGAISARRRRADYFARAAWNLRPATGPNGLTGAPPRCALRYSPLGGAPGGAPATKRDPSRALAAYTSMRSGKGIHR